MAWKSPEKFLWIHKTADSESLSHSDDLERLQVFGQAQRISRMPKIKAKVKVHTKYSQKKEGRRHHKKQGDQVKPPPSLEPDWTYSERRGVSFFLNVTLLKIITANRDASFWKGIVPCLTEQHPAFRHLVVAIASTHELLYQKDANKLYIFALEQSNKAAQLLLSSTKKLEPSLLLVSCILVTAYHLLRSDLASADRSIESGLKLGMQPENGAFTSGTAWDNEKLRLVLSRLGGRHGFKLWAPDVVFQFDKSNITSKAVNIATDCVRGPFVNTGQVLASYKALLLGLVAKTQRNLARGAIIDPHGPLAQAISQQLSAFSFYWELYYSQIPPEDANTLMELIQLRVGYYGAYVLFHGKLLGASELAFDSLTLHFQKMLDLAEEAIAARHAGRPVIYVDRVVNGALFTLGVCCHDPELRRRAAALLQSQGDYEEGLANKLLGMLVDMVLGVEERGLDVQSCHDIPENRRIHLVGAHCREKDKAICLEYTECTAADRVKTKEAWSAWDSSYGVDFSATEIEDCLQGILAAYTMYGKADVSRAPHGYVHPMYFRGKPVVVYREETRQFEYDAE